MKKYISYMMMVMLALGILSSCNQEIIQDYSYGYLGVSLDNDLSEDLVTKADGEPVFALDVLDKNNVIVASREDCLTTLTDPIELRVGSYSIVARSGERLNEAFDRPYYEGRTEEPVKIRPERTSEIDITCSLANTVFSAEFTEDFNEFSEYEVAVTNGTGNRLVLSSSPEAGNALEAGFDSKAYFAVTGTLTWEFCLRNSDGGIYRTSETYTDVKAKQHYHLKFALGNDETSDGALILKVTLDNNWTDNDHDIELDFIKAGAPDITVNGSFAAVSGVPVSMQVGDRSTKVLSFSAGEGMKSLTVAHSSAKLAAAGVPQNLELVGASEELLSSLEEAGFVVADGLESIDLTGLFSTLKAGTYDIEFTLTDKKDEVKIFRLIVKVISDEIVIEAEAVAAKAGWAAFAQLEGRFFDVDNAGAVTFEYRKTTDPEWIEVDRNDVKVDASAMTMTAVVDGLAPETEYVFRAVTVEQKDTKTLSFTTAAAGTLHNLNFDSWYKSGKAWIPNADANNYIWDSANPGTADLPLGYSYVPTTPEENDVVKGKAARLETMLVDIIGIKKLAAGNIYTGLFGSVEGVGAKLKWGVPFTSRPLALRGYWKYAPKSIDFVEAPYTDKEGQVDACQVQIFLTDWTGPFEINTSESRFVDFNGPNIIARGEVITSETHDNYVPFTIPLVYRDGRIPTHIVIAGAASMLGDYFTGAVGSVLLLDEFELVYDPAELTEDEYNTVFGQVNPF